MYLYTTILNLSMKGQTEIKQGERVFDSVDTKKIFRKGIKFLAIALPLLFASPIIVTIGFKAINKGGSYIILILGCLLTLFTIALVTQAFRLILKSLFNK